MPTFHTPEDFLRLAASFPLFDVRSPAEYSHGHIPQAMSLPLFSDSERAAVGTAYSRQGADAAVQLGLEYAGPQLAQKLLQAKQCASTREICLHCWRGGMRSQSMAWLLETGGFTVHLLTGGYRAYRNLVREDLARPRPVLVLGGMTGCGKTDILLSMREQGGQIIDLEGLANHRGSAFGAVGLGAQPSNEHMENLLHAQWRALDPSRPVWLEDESQRIGSVHLDASFFAHLEQGPLVSIDLPEAARIKRLLRIYTSGDFQDDLLTCLVRIRKRLGDTAFQHCTAAVASGDYPSAVQGILHYYDKAYLRQMSYRTTQVQHFDLAEDNPAKTAARLLAFEEQWQRSSKHLAG